MMTESKLRKVLALLLQAALDNPQVMNEIGGLIDPEPKVAKPRGAKKTEKTPAAFDPFATYRDGETGFVARLEGLSADELKAIIREYGLDPTKSASRMRAKDKLLKHVLMTTKAMFHQGDAFRG